MEESHQKVIDELQRKHQREIENLQEEKERLLAEETAATIAGEAQSSSTIYSKWLIFGVFSLPFVGFWSHHSHFFRGLVTYMLFL